MVYQIMNKTPKLQKELQFLKKSWHGSWKVPAKLNPWKWAEANLSFSNLVSPLPGRYSTSSTPYVRAVLEAAANPHTRHITMCWSAQSSKTTTALIMMYYAIANDPGNALLVRPSLQAAKSLSENKIQVVINENKALSCHKTGDKDDYTKTAMKLKNMVIFIRGASANQLSAETCKLVILDETDKYESYSDSKAEADLVALAYERTKYYKNHLKVDTSTPTIPSGRIWQLYHEGDMCLYMVPCPHCGAFFNFEMKHFKFDKEKPKKTAHFECPHCSEKIIEKHKYKMMQAGFWEAQTVRDDEEHKSYQLPEFYSPITRWGELAEKFVKATARAKLGDFGQLHNFINSSLAEPWDVTANASRNVEQLMALQDNRLAGTVPDVATGLTIGIDTQGAYFECTIRAWSGSNMESWLVLHKVLPDFESIVNIMKSEYPSVDGTKIFRITGGLIDSGGDKTAEVYEFCRKHPHLRLRPSKGYQTLGAKPYEFTKLDKYPNGQAMPGGLKLVKVNTTYYKDKLAGKMSVEANEEGAFHLHANVDADYLKHMCAEYRNNKGVWFCPKHKHNECFDTEVLSMLVADMLNLRFLPVVKGEVTVGEIVQEVINNKGNTPNNGKPVNQKKRRLPIYKENPYTSGIKIT